jgi:hypothetical protein
MSSNLYKYCLILHNFNNFFLLSHNFHLIRIGKSKRFIPFALYCAHEPFSGSDLDNLGKFNNYFLNGL